MRKGGLSPAGSESRHGFIHTYTGWMVVMSSLVLGERRIGVGVDRPIEIWIGEDADAIGGVDL